MNRFRPLSRTRGFSLLEVLIAVVIMSIGLLALAMLQLSLMRSSNEAKAQSVALAIAKQRLEDMRSFETWPQYIAITDPTSGTVSQGGVDYTVTGTVERFGLDTDLDPDAYAAAPSDTATDAQMAAGNYVAGRDFKRVSISVSWADATGNWGTTPTNVRTVTLEDIVEGLIPADSARVVKNTSSSKPRNIQVIITDPSLTTGVIPVAISGTSSTAATNPKPELGGKDGDAVQETRFDILTYSGLTGANSGKALAQARVETVIASCRCDTATKPTGTTARGYRPTYWNGVRYIAPTLTTYVPPAGQEVLGNQESQSSHCDVCCRDHHDPGAITTAKFDPWRGNSGHEHYGLTNAGVLEKVGVNGRTKYLETCRLIRTDGILRVAADYRDEYFNFLRTVSNNGDTGFAPYSTAVTNYQAFVLGYLDAKVVDPTDSSTTPATSAYNNKVTGTPLSTLVTNNSLDDPATIAIQRTNDDHKWLHSRGLYVDYLEKEALKAILAAKTACNTNSCTAAQKRSAVLTVLPFTSINVTELSKFTPTSSPAYLHATNESFSLASLSWTTNPPQSGDVTTTGTIPNAGVIGQVMTGTFNDSNTGLAASAVAIDVDEVSQTDTQLFDISAGGSSSTTGNFKVTFSGYSFPSSNPPGVVPPTGSCSRAAANNGTPLSYYACGSVTLPASTLVLGGSAKPYNYQAPTDVGGQTIKCTCVAPEDGCTLGTQYDYVLPNNTQLRTCRNYHVGSVTANVGDAAITSNVSTTPDGAKTESTTLTFSPLLDANDEITINWVLDGTPTIAPGYTCNFTKLQSGEPKSNTVSLSDTGTCP